MLAGKHGQQGCCPKTDAPLVAVRHDIELSALEHEVGMDKTDKGASQRDERAQERPIRECFAEHRGDDSTCREAEQKRCMRLDLAAQPMVFGMSGELCEIRSDLADMVRHERRSRRHAFHLAIRIELHRADEVQRHLADLVRPRSRHEGKKDNSTHISSAMRSVSQRRKCMCLMVLPIHSERKEPKK